MACLGYVWGEWHPCILSTLITKKDKVPSVEINRCIANKKLVESNFEKYTYSEIEEDQ